MKFSPGGETFTEEIAINLVYLSSLNFFVTMERYDCNEGVVTMLSGPQVDLVQRNQFHPPGRGSVFEFQTLRLNFN